MTSNFDEKYEQILESLELIEEKKYARWLDQKGKKVYPGLLTDKEMKKLLPRRLGIFQKNAHLYQLPLVPTKGKLQKAFKKVYKRSFGVRPFA